VLKARRGSRISGVHACLLVSGMGVGWLIGLAVSPVLQIIVASVVALAVGIVGALAGLESGSKKEDESEPSRTTSSSYKGLVNIDPLPMSALISGLVIGASIGVYARTNELLGADPRRLVQRWSGASGLDEASIKRRLFDQLYPPVGAASPSNREEMAKKDEEQKQAETRPPAAPDINSRQDGKLEKTQQANPVGTIPAISNRQEKVEKSQTAKPSTVQSSATPHTAGLFSVAVGDCDLLVLKHGDILRLRLKGLNNRRINVFLDRCSSDDCLEALKEMLCTERN
jgi:hypothetical protein